MTRLRSERGAALITALLIMTLVGGLAVVSLNAVDAFQRSTGDRRVRDGALYLAQTALDAALVPLSGKWPATAIDSVPATCSSSSAPAGCPSPASIAATVAGTEAAGGTWTVEIRDDAGSPLRYDRAALQTAGCPTAPCRWDSDANARVWVRSSAVVLGRRRTVVSLVQRPQIRFPLPRATAVAGYFKTTNNGNKILVDERGCSPKIAAPTPTCASNQPAPISVRCTTAAPAVGDPCLSYAEGQISPPIATQYTGSVITPEVLAVMREEARRASTYYNGVCPTVPQLTGAAVFIENVPSGCSYTGSGTINSASQLGRIVVHRGSIEFGGTLDIYALVMATNGLTPPADAGILVTTRGDATIQGAVFVEGAGGIALGSSNMNLNFDERALGDLTTWGPPGFLHHSFRELTPTE